MASKQATNFRNDLCVKPGLPACMYMYVNVNVDVSVINGRRVTAEVL